MLLGVGQPLEGVGHLVEADLAGDHRDDVDLALGDRAQAGGELQRVVAEHELHVELLADAVERVDRVRLHAHADDDHPAQRRRQPHHLVDHPRHADGLEHDERAATTDRRPPPERLGLRRVDDLVGAHRLGEPASGGGEVAGHDRPDTAQSQGGDDGEAHRTAAEHQRAVTGGDARPVHGVEPDGHRLGEGGVARVEAVGHLDRQQRRQQHPLAVAAREQVRVGEVLHPRRGHHGRHGRHEGALRRPDGVRPDLQHACGELVAHEHVA